MTEKAIRLKNNYGFRGHGIETMLDEAREKMSDDEYIEFLELKYVDRIIALKQLEEKIAAGFKLEDI